MDPGNRDELGRFPPGKSGNPSGRPKIDPEVIEMLKCATVKAARRAIEALDAERTFVVGTGQNSRLETAPDHDMRLKAYNAIFDRLYGKPSQAVTGEDGGPVNLGLVFLPSEKDG